jgi:hypothetical protein
VEAEYGTERFLKKGFMGVRSAWYRIDGPFFPKSRSKEGKYIGEGIPDRLVLSYFYNGHN